MSPFAMLPPTYESSKESLDLEKPTPKEDPELIFTAYERYNPLMQALYKRDVYVMKKKSNYMERILCSAYSADNVYKIYEWHELNVLKGLRLARFQQTSPLCMRSFCCSHQRSYRTLGEISNRTKIITKSLRTYRWMCPCNKRKPITAVFDA